MRHPNDSEYESAYADRRRARDAVQCARRREVYGDDGTASPYAAAKAHKAALEYDVARASAALDAFPTTGPLGLTPDHIKSSVEFIAARDNYRTTFARLRSFNTSFLRVYKKAIAVERTAGVKP